jgi:tRNA(Leu) C34 or U34 (ribose-2'-O)-methylase TrmL
LLLEARPLPPVALDALPAKGVVLALDQISDPHNVGAILRTAAAFGVEALVTTDRHRPEFSGVLAKAASGGLEVVPICVVTNLARALGDLADLGYWRVGLDSEAPIPLGQAKLTKPLVLVMGAEGPGLRRLTREHCDELARLDLPGPIKSLNVSNATGRAADRAGAMNLGARSGVADPANPPLLAKAVTAGGDVGEAFVDVGLQSGQFPALQSAFHLPIAQRGAHDLVALRDRALHDGGHIGRQGDGQALDVGLWGPHGQ